MDELKRKKYVYIVIGMCHDCDGFAYRMVNETCVYRTLQKAKEEIQRVKQETIQEANDNGYEVIINETDNGEGLEIEYETGTTENWNIYKREIL